MDCICTFQACHLEEHLSGFYVLLSETMFQSGIGFRNTIPKRYRLRERRWLNLLWMKRQLRQVLNMSGFGLPWSLKISKFSHCPYTGKETYLLPSAFY